MGGGKGQARPKETELPGRLAERRAGFGGDAGEPRRGEHQSHLLAHTAGKEARTGATPLGCEFIRLTCTAYSEERKTSGHVGVPVRKCHDRDHQQDTDDAH